MKLHPIDNKGGREGELLSMGGGGGGGGRRHGAVRLEYEPVKQQAPLLTGSAMPASRSLCGAAEASSREEGCLLMRGRQPGRAHATQAAKAMNGT